MTVESALTLTGLDGFTFLLVLVRVAGLVTVAPILGHRAIPIMHRAGLAALLALVLVSTVKRAAPARTLVHALLVIGGEFVAGAIIGFLASMLLAAVHGAAEVVGFQMGFGVAAAFDPALGQQTTVLARFEESIVLLLFLGINGHHLLIEALALTLRRLEPGTVGVAVAAGGVVALGSKLFRSALDLAAPLVGVLFIVNVAMALLARAAPQMNVFGVGLPVMIAVGLVTLTETLPYIAAVVIRLTDELGWDIGVILGAARGI